jgi:ParB-like chromosome segregation protein Spo0J
MAVSCQALNDDANATEIGLAENTVREQMHPADEFEAFRALIDGGASIAGVAARFGHAESAVENRLRLARVSPVIIEGFRNDQMTLEQVMAFAVSDDHAAQERLLRPAVLPLRRAPQQVTLFTQLPTDPEQGELADLIAAAEFRQRFPGNLDVGDCHPAAIIAQLIGPAC